MKEELNPWATKFNAIYHAALERYRGGAKNVAAILTADEAAYLKSNGIKPVNVFDYVDDFERYGAPCYDTALLLASARREYFLLRQNGVWPETTTTADTLPPKTDAMDGIVWLPRILPKARAFLTGELEDDIMYGCGGDRKFFTGHGINPVDFLRVVEAACDDDSKVSEYVKSGVSPRFSSPRVPSH